MAVLVLGTVRAQSDEVIYLSIVSDAPDFSAGYGVTKNLQFEVANFGDAATIPAGVLNASVALPANTEIDYDALDLPDGFVALTSEADGLDGIYIGNEEDITLAEGETILFLIPVKAIGVVPSDGGTGGAPYFVEIEFYNPEGIALFTGDGLTSVEGTISAPNMEDPLPVNFLSFVASGNDCKVNLEWKTSNEMRTGSFAVERSHNGSDYTTLGLVRAIEAATATLDYTYTDAQPLNGTSFYRIRQMDLEGKSTFSQARMIYGDCGNATVRMYPNPAADYILVDGVEAGSQIVVYNVLGQVIISKEATAANERINLSEIAAGSYTLNVVKGNNIVFSGIVLKK